MARAQVVPKPKTELDPNDPAVIAAKQQAADEALAKTRLAAQQETDARIKDEDAKKIAEAKAREKAEADAVAKAESDAQEALLKTPLSEAEQVEYERMEAEVMKGAMTVDRSMMLKLASYRARIKAQKEG